MRTWISVTIISLLAIAVAGLPTLGCDDSEEGATRYYNDYLEWTEIPFATGSMDTDTDSDTDTDTDVDEYWDPDTPLCGCEDNGAPGDVLALADDDVLFFFLGFLLHWDGAEVRSYYADIMWNSSGIFALDQDDVWVWGALNKSGAPYILRRAGDGWVPEAMELPDYNYAKVMAIWGSEESDLKAVGQIRSTEGDQNVAWEYESGSWHLSSVAVPSYDQMYSVTGVIPSAPAVFAGKNVMTAGEEVTDLEYPGDYAAALMGESASRFWVAEGLSLWGYDGGGWAVEAEADDTGLEWEEWEDGALHGSGDLYLAGGRGGFGDSGKQIWLVNRWDGESMASLIEPCADHNCGIAGISTTDSRIWVTAKHGWGECLLMWAQIP